MEVKEENVNDEKKVEGALTGFSSSVSTTPRIFWKSRRRSGNILSKLQYPASGRNLDKVADDSTNETPGKQEGSPTDEKMEDASMVTELSERRKALFEPLDPVININGKRPTAESLLPPPDFDSASYPKGWLIGKKRKLVNVDVVESMRRIAIQEMNRKDREINGLNEQLEEDARCMEHLQIQLLQERSKRAEVERENTVLNDQISILMNMLEENESLANEGTDDVAPNQP